MENINIIKDYKEEKNTSMILILVLSMLLFVAYIFRLGYIINGELNFEFTRSDFIRTFNTIMCILVVISCLLSYNSNKKEELFFILIMYIVFALDIIISNQKNLLSSNIDTYIAMGSSGLKVIIALFAVINAQKIRNLILRNKLKVLIATMLISIIVINAEYNYNIPKFMQNQEFFIGYNLIIFIIYLVIAIIFFKRSILEKEYIYGVIASTVLIFAVQAIYTIAGQITRSEEIKLTSVSLSYIGFIIFILGLFIELSQSIKKNKILDEQRSLFFKIVEESENSSIIICDEEWNIKYLNKRALEACRSLHFIDEKKCDNRIELKKMYNNEEQYQKIEEQIKINGYYNENIHISKFDKRIDISIQEHKKNNKILKVITLKDITKQYEMEKAILEYEHMKEEENMKNEFFSNISHELKTPLNIIYSTMQLLNLSIEKDNLKEMYLKYKNTLDINSKRMIRLIDNIVDVTKLEVGFKVPEYNNYEIVSIVEGITMSTINYAKMKEIDVLFDTEIEELEIKCDPDMIERILLNLLSNSIKFTNQKGNILVDMKVDEKWVSVKVKDDGIGIPVEKHSIIFDRFVQGDKSIRRQHEGSGIGLSIVKYLVELMGGDVYLESDGVNGCEFTVLLPNEKLDEKNNKCVSKNYDINKERTQLEFSDIYELYES